MKYLLLTTFLMIPKANAVTTDTWIVCTGVETIQGTQQPFLLKFSYPKSGGLAHFEKEFQDGFYTKMIWNAEVHPQSNGVFEFDVVVGRDNSNTGSAKGKNGAEVTGKGIVKVSEKTGTLDGGKIDCLFVDKSQFGGSSSGAPASK